MSAILSADDLNDFISPGVACIKPVETLPVTAQSENPYEVTTEDHVAATEAKLQAAQISLTDCLACSGCVTSAEAVLVSLQSHQEVLSVLDSDSNSPADAGREISSNNVAATATHSDTELAEMNPKKGKRVFVASISPQTRASLAAAMGIPAVHIGHMIDRLLLESISTNGKRGFDYVLDTAPLLSVCLHLAAKEVEASLANGTATSATNPKLPILTSECPGFVCYLEKTHPAVLPHLSRLKSPQALLGTLLKSLLPKYLGDNVDIYHVAVMPCFDKKLEASRAELTDAAWNGESLNPSRDVDCVITTRELLQLADSRNVNFSTLSSEPLRFKPSLPVPAFQTLLANTSCLMKEKKVDFQQGTSGGYLVNIIQELQLKHPGSSIIEKRGRNSDVVEFILLSLDGETEILKMARFYGFRNIQNLVRKLKPAKLRMLPGAPRKLASKGARTPISRGGGSSSSGEYCYVEVMACPGGCTNGGGQLKPDDPFITDSVAQETAAAAVAVRSESKAWLAKVDEAYFSADEEPMQHEENAPKVINNLEYRNLAVEDFLKGWATESGILLDTLVYTTYRAVESNVGKTSGEMSTLQAAELAQKVGGGW
ncbi:Cytosolic Fe-S cluster assembly factor nar1 [Orbilia ellipsospora]|uniref:Cytosolic Fe-S cluster assembly factor NAR1 n=1 Tax=Orbilia ellipsospora TaxID=2528407 RepID=A0AAV9XDR7_9PEZI